MQDKDGYCAGEYGAGYPEIVDLLVQWGVHAERTLGAEDRWVTWDATCFIHACHAALPLYTPAAQGRSQAQHVCVCVCVCLPCRRAQRAQSGQGTTAVNADYLTQRLTYSEDGTKLLDADGKP